MAASRKPPPLPARKAAGSWVIQSATTVNGKGISLAGGFIQSVIRPGANGVTALSRSDGMLIVERSVNGNRQHIEIPLVAVALELVPTDG